jgi:hypothetical protein
VLERDTRQVKTDRCRLDLGRGVPLSGPAEDLVRRAVDHLAQPSARPLRPVSSITCVSTQSQAPRSIVVVAVLLRVGDHIGREATPADITAHERVSPSGTRLG